MYSRTSFSYPNKEFPFLEKFRSESPLAGSSTITFHAYWREIRVHGFLQREVREMKGMVEGRGGESKSVCSTNALAATR